MNRYWIGRILETIPMLLGISLLTFIMFQLAPGDPVALVVDPTLVTEEQREAVREDLGLNDGLPTQYARMMLGIVDGDLRSFKSKQPVTDVLREALPVTLVVTAAGMTLADVVKFNAYITRADLIPVYRDARDRVLGNTPPAASTLVVVAALANPAWVVEIDHRFFLLALPAGGFSASSISITGMSSRTG